MSIKPNNYDKRDQAKKHEKAVTDAFAKRMDGDKIDLGKMAYSDAILVRGLIECLKEQTLRFKVPKLKIYLKKLKTMLQTKEQDLTFLDSVTEQRTLVHPPYQPISPESKNGNTYSYEGPRTLKKLSEPLPPKPVKYRCGRCGRRGHNRRSCTFKTHVNGGTLIRKPKRRKK